MRLNARIMKKTVLETLWVIKMAAMTVIIEWNIYWVVGLSKMCIKTKEIQQSMDSPLDVH